MALPTSRDVTIYPGTPIPSYLLNSVQDFIVAHEAVLTPLAARKRGDVTRTICPIAGQFTNCSYNEPSGYVVASTAPWSAAIPLVVENGDRIKVITFARFGTAGANQMNLSLRKVTIGGTRSVVETLNIVNAPNAWNESVLTLASPETVASGTQYYVFVDGAQSAQRFNSIRVTDDRP